MEKEEQKETEKQPLRVDNFLLWVFDTLAEKGWAYLGLVPHPESQKMEEDLGQVKLVIPLLEKIFELVKEQVPFQRRIQMETMITNIQLNFVKKQEARKS